MFKRKTAFIIIAFMLSVILTSCSSHGVNTGDVSNKFFASSIYTIDYNTETDCIYKQGKNIVIITETRNSNDYMNDLQYKKYVINDKGELSDGTLLNVKNPCGFCAVGNDNTACFTAYQGFVILDNDGYVLKTETITDLNNEQRYDIESAGDGFVIASSEEAMLYNTAGECKGKIVFDDIGFISEERPYFEVNGQGYLSVESDPGITSFYKLDFENGTYYEAGDNTAFGFSDDYAIYRYGGYSYDEDNGVISKLDPETHECTPIAYIDNCLCPPPSEPVTTNIYTYILDNETFARIYRYDSDKTEIIIMTQTDSFDYADRTRIHIKGSGVRQDNSILMAAYKFNTMQDKYYVCVSDFGDKYKYNNAAEAQRAKMLLITDFQSGDTPDMFYGNDFDYEQMGKSGMVLDVMPYLSQGSIKSITGSIRNLMITDGHCYSVFSGYTLYGFVGRQTQYDCNDCSIDGLPNLNPGQNRINPLYAHDIADHMIRYSIMNPKKRNDVLSLDNLRKMVNTALSMGAAPSETLSPDDRFESGEDSLSLRYINNDIREYMLLNKMTNDRVVFVGFPAINGSNRAIRPSGLVAVSSGTKNPEACVEFASLLLSPEIQKMNYNNGTIPVNETVLDEYLGYMVDPDTIPDNERVYREMASMMQAHIGEDGYLTKEKSFISIDSEYAQQFKNIVTDVNTIITMDWGIYTIICEEIDSHYSNGKSVDKIASTLESRLRIYLDENYT